MNRSERDYISQYWVGLMDGDGSVQVNHWRKKSLQYRLVINLKSDPGGLNLFLLERVRECVGGSVTIDTKGGRIVWVENHRKRVLEILKLFNDHPPVTRRVCFQWHFLRECMKRQSVEWYLLNRSKKYAPEEYTVEWEPPTTLAGRGTWLSGFIEAEGCFTLRGASSKVKSFSIFQKGERDLLRAISAYFGGEERSRLVLNKKQRKTQNHPPEGGYALEVYNPSVLERIVAHCTLFPLYGEKKNSLEIFSKSLQ